MSETDLNEWLFDRIRYQRLGPVARVTLANPAAGNALDLPMAQAFEAAARKVDDGARAGDVRVAILAAEGRMFSVGGDLRGFADAADPAALMAQVAGAVHAGLILLAATPVPVITLVAGTAAGGGMGIALAGDIVLAAAHAKFVTAYTAAGLSPDCGTSWQLASRAGTAVALDLALTNRPLTAAEALQHGLVSRVLPGDALTDEGDLLAGALAAGSPAALAATKTLVRDATTTALAQQLDAEARSISYLVASPDGHEGIHAFLEKRKPKFN